MALNITKDKHNADELVQCMYMRILDYKVSQEKVSDEFVNVVMINIFKESKKKAEFKNTHIHPFGQYTSDYGVAVSLEVINYIKGLCANNHVVDYDDKELEIIEAIEELSDFDKSILELSYSNSIRKVAKIKDIGHRVVYRALARIRWEVLGVRFSKEYRNRRLKYNNLKQA